jgi:hypothetical protein
MEGDGKKIIFDIVPATAESSESLDLKNPSSQPPSEVEPRTAPLTQVGPVEEGPPEQNSGLNDLMSEILQGDPKEDAKYEMEMMMAATADPIVELTSTGVLLNAKNTEDTGYIVHNSEAARMNLSDVSHIEVRNQYGVKKEPNYDKILAHIRAPVTAKAVARLSSLPNIPAKPVFAAVTAKAAPQPFIKKETPKIGPKPGYIISEKIISKEATEIENFYTKAPSKQATLANVPFVQPSFGKADFNFAPPKKKNYSKLFFVAIVAVGIFAYGMTLKHELVNDSTAALENIKKAQTELENFDFSGAAVSFQKSYDNFTKASQNLDMVGAGLAGLIGDLPGMGKVRSAKDITEAGKLLSSSGKAMSEALTALSQTGKVLNPTSVTKTKPSRIISQLKTALDLSAKNFDKAKALISGIDESIIPEDKKDAFLDFKSKIPILEKTLKDAEEYTDFLESMIGIDEPKKYLLLFNNNSELRPTGGFPGTYGVVSFSGGGLSDFFVNDVYNLDGQLKRNVIPPKQLQHITPTWGMRDASWFIDFPDSARKAEAFFAEESGYKVNGVITLNPDIVSKILAVVGPIEMSEYDLILTADNFLENIQEEVEYGPNRSQPKQVLTDLAPRMLERLYSADSEKWLKIFNVLMAGVEENDIQFYFNDKELENFSVEKGFGGEIKNTVTGPGQSGDYLNINFSNIKGSKTDAVTDSSVEVETDIKTGHISHRVTLVRNHKGGDKEHGFYNRQNPAYVRVLLPENADVLSVSGYDVVNFKPLVSYNGISFEKDSDLEHYESGFSFDKKLGTDRFQEKGKQGLGFWMVLDPGTSKKVVIEYTVPLAGSDYSFYFQKQPGLDWKNFTFVINGKNVESSFPELNKIGSSYIFDEELKKDIELKIKLK